MSTHSRQRDEQQPRRNGGPIGGLIKLVGTGVGAAVEYHGHRKQRKAAARDSAQTSPVEEDSVVAGPSSQPAAFQRSTVVPNNPPPSYYQSTNNGQQQDRQLASGPPAANDDKKDPNLIDSDTDSDYISDELTPLQEDEEAWQLDDLAASTEPPSYEASTSPSSDPDLLIHDLATLRQTNNRLSNSNKNNTPTTPLLLPVIIPQRRPRNKSRGFVRAYSPVLENVGIDQATFLRFLKTFHSASQANPIFTAITVAAQIAGLVPEPIVMAVTISLQVAAGIGKEIDSRRKTNNFLDRMNEEMFKPAGCFAFIMKYKSDAEVAKAAASGGGLLARLGIGAAEVDFSASNAIAKYDSSSSIPGADGSSGSGKLSAKMKKIRLVSGETRGSAKIVEAAPLIYPEIDEVVYSGKDGEETFKDKTKDAKKFLAGYVDRRAQMKYAEKDPASALLVPESERASHSKWSDPNHPMFNGGLIGLVSGGYIDAGKHRADKRERKLDRKEARFERKEARFERRHGGGGPRLGAFQSSPGLSLGMGGIAAPDASSSGEQDPDYFNRRITRRASPRERKAARSGGVIGAVKKVMQEDVLYLMIVPMPSEAEMAEARDMLAREKERN